MSSPPCARRWSKLEYAHTSFFTTEAAEALADDLVAHAPDGIGHVYLVSGGSEAIEAALKLARQYFVERGEPQRTKIHRPSTELPRQHAGRAGRRRQPRAAARRSSRCSSRRITSTPCYAYRHRAPPDESEEAYGAARRRRARGEASSSSAPRRSSPSSPRRSSARPPARSPPRRAISRRSAKSATATACS